MKKGYSLLIFLVFLSYFLRGQSNTGSCADDQYTQSGGGICALCNVFNEYQAVDGNNNTYSTITVPVGLLNAEMSQFLVFADTGAAGSTATLILEDPAALLSASLGSNLIIESYLGNNANGDAITVTPSVVSLISGSNKYALDFNPTASFDRIKVTLQSGLLSADLGSIRIYSACYTPNLFPPQNISPFTQSNGISGICLLCGVTNPTDAIDGDESTPATLNVTLGALAPQTWQTYEFTENSCLGEEITLILENPAGLLSVALLGNASLEFLNASDAVLQTHALNYNNLQLLSGSSKYRYVYTPLVSYEKIRITLNGGLLGALSSLNVYEVYKNKVAPPIAVQDTVYVCEGSSALLQSLSGVGTTVNYFTSLVGNTLLGTGEFLNTPILNVSTSYFIETVVDSSGCYSDNRQEIFVKVLPEAPDPILNITTQTVFSGDGYSINPGPTNYTFNFYADAAGTQLLHTGAYYNVDSIYSDSTIYVQTNLSGCLSDNIASIQLQVAPGPGADPLQDTTSICSDSTSTNGSGLCVGCGVFNAQNAVDGNTSTYSTLQTTIGLLGADVSQTFVYNQQGEAGNTVSMIVEDPTGLLALTVGGNIQVETMMGATSNNDAITINSGVLSVLPGSNKYNLEFPAGGSFDRVKVTLQSSLLAADLASFRIYEACFRNDPFISVPVSPTNQTSTVSGLLCLACGVSDGTNAIDGNDTTYSTINVTLGVLGSAAQTFDFGNNTCLGEPLEIIIENPGGLLSVALLSDVQLDLLDASGNVVANQPLSYNDLQLLSGSNKYIYRFKPTVNFEKVKITVNSGLASVLSSLRVYEVARLTTPLPIPASDTVLVCDGTEGLLQASAPAGSTIQWFADSTGGTPFTTGTAYNTGILTTDTAYYIGTTVDSSGCLSVGRRKIFVDVIPQAPNPVLLTNAESVLSGDDLAINPGPANAIFNFYADASGNQLLATGSSFQLDSITANTTIWVQTNLNGCLSTGMDSLVVTVSNVNNPNPTVPGGACADSTSTNVTGLCVLCDVFNAENAVDGNPATYSTLQTTIGLLGADVSQMVLFPQTGTAGDNISVTLEDPSGLLAASLGGNLQIETFNGNSSNNDAFTVTPAAVTVLQGTSKYTLTFAASADFDRVQITLASSLLSADIAALRIYEVCYLSAPVTDICVKPVNQSSSVSGLLCLGCNVANGINAIDEYDSTYSQLNVSIGVLGSASQTFTLAEPSCVGEPMKLVVENPGGLLSAALLADIDVEALDAANNVVGTYTINVNQLELISGTTQYNYVFKPTQSFQKIRFTLNSGLASLLSSFRIYDVCKNAVAPPAPLKDSVLACENFPITLNAYAAPSTTVKWYADSTGGTALASGNDFTTGILTTDTAFYLETEVDSSGCLSPYRTKINVEVVPEAPAPIINTRQVNVLIGDGYTINPGPSNAIFNFYTDASGTQLLATGSQFTLDSIYTDSTIWIQTNLNGCLSNMIDSVVFTTDSTHTNFPDIPGGACADSTNTNVSGLCVLCDVFNPENAVDGNPTTYATLQTTVGLLGADVTQNVIFSQAGMAGDNINITLEDPSGLLAASLGGNLKVETFNGNSSNNDTFTVTNGVLSALTGTSKYILTFPASADFDRVQITLEASTLSADLFAVRLYEVCYESAPISSVCVKPVNQSSDVTGLLCLVCSVDDGINAIDAYDTTYSQLNVSIGVLGSASQTFTLADPNCVGESMGLVIEYPGGLLTAALLADIDVEALDAANNVVQSFSIAMNQLDLISGTSRYNYNFTPTASLQKIRVVLNSGLASVLSSIRIYDVCKKAVAPPALLNDTVLACESFPVTLSAYSAAGTTVKWFTDSLGGTEIATGNNFTTGILMADTAFYLETEVDSSGCLSPYRTKINVEVVPEAPAPVLSSRSETVLVGDGLTINPGPANAVFNFYADAAGMVLLGTGPSLQLDSIFTDTTIWVQTNLNGCLSNMIDSVVITTDNNNNPNPPVGTGACADSTFAGVSNGLCVLCNVFNPEQAVDGNPTTYSTLQTTIGLLGADVYQTVIFSQPGVSGNKINITLEDPSGLLGASLGGNLAVETFNGTVSNNDAFTVAAPLLTLLPGGNKYVLSFPASADFDRVQITLTAGVLSADLTALRIYEVCYESVPATSVCVKPVNQSSSVSGLLCLACNVTDGINAIDAYDTTYSQLNVTLGVAGSASQTFTFAEASCIGEGMNLTLENPAGLLSAALIADIDVEALDASDNVVEAFTVSMNQLQLLSGTGIYNYGFTPTVSFSKIRVTLNTGLASLLSSLRIYDVCKEATAPPAPVSDTVLACEGFAAVLQAYSANGTTINWFTDSVGGTAIATGNTFTTGVLFADTIYYLETEVDSSGCLSPYRSSIYVNVVPEAPAPVVTVDTVDACFGDAVTITPQTNGAAFNFYANSNNTILLAAGVASYSVDSLFADSTIYVRTNLNGCISPTQDSVFIRVNNGSATPQLSSDSLYACLDANLTVEVQNPDPTLTYTYFDAASGGNVLGTGTNYTLTSVTDTTTIYVESSNGVCTSPVRAVATAMAVNGPDITIGGADIVTLCTGNAAVLTAMSSIGDSVYWYDAPVGGTLLAVGDTFTYTPATTPSTVYATGYLDAGACESVARDSVTIILGSNVNVTLASDSVIVCSGNAATFTASSVNSGAVFTWYDAPTGGNTIHTGATFSFTPVTNDTSVYVSAMVPGCGSSPRVKATAYILDSLIVPNTADVNTCIGSSISLSASVLYQGAGTFQWFSSPVGGLLLNVGSTFNLGTLFTSTTVYVRFVPANGCSPSERVAVNINIGTGPSPSDVAVQDTAVCSGTSALLIASGNSSGFTFEWYDSAFGGTLLATGDSLQTPAITSNTTFYVAFAENGCASSVRIPVNVTIGQGPDPSNVSVSGDGTICNGSSATLVAGGSSNAFNFNWYDAATGGTLLASNDTLITPPVTGTTTYYVEFDINGCTGTSRIPVTVDAVAQPSISLVADTLLACAGDAISLNATSSTSGATINWFDAPVGGNQIATGGTFSTILNSDTLIAYAEASIGNCASARVAAVVFDVSSYLNVNVTDTTTCVGNAITINLPAPPNGVMYRWWDAATGGNILAITNSFNTPVLNASTTYYIDIATPNGTCTNLNRAPLLVSALSELSAPVVSCGTITDTSITFTWNTVNGATGYEVSFDGGTTYVASNGATSHMLSGLTPDSTVAIMVRATGQAPCQTSTAASGMCTTSISPCPPITASYNNSFTICQGDTLAIELSNISISNYGIMVGGNVQSSNIVMVAPPADTVIDIVVFNTANAACDSVTFNVFVQVLDAPVADFDVVEVGDNSGSLNGTYRFVSLATGAVSWFWNFGDGSTSTMMSPEHTYSEFGQYDVYLIVENAAGCSDSLYVEDAVDYSNLIQFFVPNTFTPDRNSVNDQFMVLGKNISLESFEVYNPFGNKVFSTTDMNQGWDGNYQGEAQPPGVYTYVARVIDMFGNAHQKNGTVTLIR